MPSKTLQQVYPLHPHQLPASNIFEASAKMEQGGRRGQLTEEDSAPGHEIPSQLHCTEGHLLGSEGTWPDEDADVLEPGEHPTTPLTATLTSPPPPPTSPPSLQSGHQQSQRFPNSYCS